MQTRCKRPLKAEVYLRRQCQGLLIEQEKFYTLELLVLTSLVYLLFWLSFFSKQATLKEELSCIALRLPFLLVFLMLPLLT